MVELILPSVLRPFMDPMIPPQSYIYAMSKILFSKIMSSISEDASSRAFFVFRTMS